MTDAVELARELVRRPSVTPGHKDALDYLADVLGAEGFACTPLRLLAEGTPDVDNLYAASAPARATSPSPGMSTRCRPATAAGAPHRSPPKCATAG